jgi:hypothetical protein
MSSNPPSDLIDVRLAAANAGVELEELDDPVDPVGAVRSADEAPGVTLVLPDSAGALQMGVSARHFQPCYRSTRYMELEGSKGVTI